MIALEGQNQTIADEFDMLLDACELPAFRSIAQFATDEIILPPGGPKQNQPYELDTQPWSRLWFDLVQSGKFTRFAVVGPTQTGKTLTCYVIIAMYFLFERHENVGCGIPQMEMAWDKWSRDFLPVIKASRYANLIPETGIGSKGGKFNAITFTNGATLKFVSAKGDDAKRSGITFRILVMTEIDKFDEASDNSREGDPVSQMIARLDSYETLNSLIFMECTASLPKGRIWREYNNGSAAKIALLCPLCNTRVTPEREHLVGYIKATNEIDAREWSQFICPNCSKPWTEENRRFANMNAVLVHRGQEALPDGTIVGPLPKTLTAGFRWTAVNSMLRPAADVGGREWMARNDPDEDNSEKTMLQWVWAMPWTGDTFGMDITEDIVASRLTGLARMECPEDVESIVCQIDLHLRWHYYTIMATSENGARSIIDYGLRWNPDQAVIGPAEAIRKGLEDLVEELENREYITEGGRFTSLDFGMIDGGYHQEVGVEFVQGRAHWRLVKGQGRDDKAGDTKYIEPKEKTPDLRPGDHWNDRRQPAIAESNNRRWWLLFADTDHWMHQVHGSFMSEPFLEDGKTRRPGSLAIFGTDPSEHLRKADAEIVRSAYATQVCGWVWRAAASKKKGQKIGWESQYSQDHWLDTTYGCLVGDSVLRTYHPRFRKRPVQPVAVQERKRFQTPDGRPYLLTER